MASNMDNDVNSYEMACRPDFMEWLEERILIGLKETKWTFFIPPTYHEKVVKDIMNSILMREDDDNEETS